MKLAPSTRLWLWVSFLLVLGLGGIYLLLQLPVLSVPLLISFALFYVLDPLVTMWESRGYSRTSALAIIFSLFGFGLLIVGINFPSWAQKHWSKIHDRAPEMAELAKAKLAEVDQFLDREMAFLGGVSLEAGTDKAGNWVRQEVLPNIPGLMVKVVMGGLLVPILTFFLLIDGRNARKRILESIPNRHFEMALNIFYRMNEQVGSYLRGVLVEAFLVGLVAVLMLYALGGPGPILIGSVVGVTNIIPYFGPLAGLVTGIVYCALTGAVKAMYFKVVLAVVVAQLADNFIIGPAVIGKAVNVHALVVILLLLVAGNLFGLIGLVIAVPLWAVVRVVLQETFIAVRAYGRYMVD